MILEITLKESNGMKLIDKAALVAEIKRYKHKVDERLKIKGRTLAEDLKDLALQNLCGNLLHFIDTIEVKKEVDLEKELESWRHNHFHGRRDKGIHESSKGGLSLLWRFSPVHLQTVWKANDKHRSDIRTDGAYTSVPLQQLQASSLDSQDNTTLCRRRCKSIRRRGIPE